MGKKNKRICLYEPSTTNVPNARFHFNQSLHTTFIVKMPICQAKRQFFILKRAPQSKKRSMRETSPLERSSLGEINSWPFTYPA
jgi:hypothetical protein